MSNVVLAVGFCEHDVVDQANGECHLAEKELPTRAMATHMSLLHLPFELLRQSLFQLTTSELAFAAPTSQSLRTSVTTIARRRAEALGVADQPNLLHAVHIAETQKCGICRNRLIEPAAGTTQAELDEEDCTGCHIAAGACGHQFHRSCLENHIEHNRVQGCSKCGASPCMHIECPLCPAPWSSKPFTYLPADHILRDHEIKYVFLKVAKEACNGIAPDGTAPNGFISHSVFMQRAAQSLRTYMLNWGEYPWGLPPHPRRSPSYEYFRPHLLLIEQNIRRLVSNDYLGTHPVCGLP